MKFKSLLLIPLFLYSTLDAKEESYKACAETLQQAKLELSGLMNSSVSSSMTKAQKSTKDSDTERISSNITLNTKVATHLDLVNIKKTVENNQTCATAFHKDQVEHTKAMLKKSLLLDLKNLPKESKKRLEIVEKSLHDLENLSYAIPVFLQDINQTNQKKLDALSKQYLVEIREKYNIWESS